MISLKVKKNYHDFNKDLFQLARIESKSMLYQTANNKCFDTFHLKMLTHV